MSADVYIPDQTYTYEGKHYRSGRPMPLDVARALGLVDGDSEDRDEPEPEEEHEPESDGDLPEDFPYREELVEAGYDTLDAVLHAAEDELADEVKNVGGSRAEDVKEAANDALEAQS